MSRASFQTPQDDITEEQQELRLQCLFFRIRAIFGSSAQAMLRN